MCYSWPQPISSPQNEPSRTKRYKHKLNEANSTQLLHSNWTHVGATFLGSRPQLNARCWIRRGEFTIGEYYHLGSSLHFPGKEWVRGDDNSILEFRRQFIMDSHSSSWIIMDQQQQQQQHHHPHRHRHHHHHHRHHHHHHHHLHHKYYQLDIISIYHCCHCCHRCQNNYGGWKMKKLTGNQQVKHIKGAVEMEGTCVSEGLRSCRAKDSNNRTQETTMMPFQRASHWYPTWP